MSTFEWILAIVGIAFGMWVLKKIFSILAIIFWPITETVKAVKKRKSKE